MVAGRPSYERDVEAPAKICKALGLELLRSKRCRRSERVDMYSMYAKSTSDELMSYSIL